jgi:hypothetical protein
MRTLILILACLGVGYAIAKYRVDTDVERITNLMGNVADIESEIAKAKSVAELPGKIEVIGGMNYNFGTMKQGSKRAHSFTFKNTGSKPVRLAYKASSCKCTVGKLDDSLLQPLAETDVEMEWYAEKGNSDFSQTATIGTDAPGQEEIKLTVSGRIGVGQVFSPAYLEFGDCLATEEKSFDVTLFSFEDSIPDIVLGAWNGSDLVDKFKVDIGEIRKPKENEFPDYADAKYVVFFKVNLLKGVRSGRFSGEIVLQGKDSPQSKLGVARIPANGRSISTISVVGGPDYAEEANTLNLGSASTKIGLKKGFLVKLKTLDGSTPTIKVKSVEPELAERVCKVTIGEPKVSGNQSMFPVVVEIPAGTAPCEIRGMYSKDFAKIVFETNVENAIEYPMYVKFMLTE